jgi:hypothetical protein
LRKTEVIDLEGKTKTLLVSTVLVLAVLSGIALVAYANGLTDDTSTGTSTTSNGAWFTNDQYYNGTCPSFGRGGFEGRGRGGGGRGMDITVSDEYKANVLNITESDSDVQALIAQGYNVTGVRPIISATVGADGTVTMKASTAIVMLQKDTTGRALVWVDVDQAKVTRIEILTRTVIEKP